MKESTGCHIWTCSGCGIGMSKIYKMVQSQGIQIAGIKQEVTKNTSDIADNRSQVENLNKEVANLKITTNNSSSDSALAEIDDREARKLNLIIHGIEDDTSENAEDRKKADQDIVSKIFKVLEVDTNNRSVKFVARLGEKSQEDNRPIKIGLRSNDMKEHILENCWRLADSAYDHVSISPDLTQKQRRHDAKMRDDMKKQNEELTDEDKSKNLQWKLVGNPGQKKLIKGLKRLGKNKFRPRIQSHKRKMSTSEKEGVGEDEEDNMEEDKNKEKNNKRARTKKQS